MNSEAKRCWESLKVDILERRNVTGDIRDLSQLFRQYRDGNDFEPVIVDLFSRRFEALLRSSIILSRNTFFRKHVDKK